MKPLFVLFTILTIVILLAGCASQSSTDIVVTTSSVFTFTSSLTEGTGLSVTQLINDNVSCLHDYTLQVSQMQLIQSSEAVVISGAGLEDFMEDALNGANYLIDASEGLILLEGSEHSHTHEESHHGHIHQEDPHIWLSPKNAKTMAQNICHGLSHLYPQHESLFHENLQILLQQLDDLDIYAQTAMQNLSCRELITFHDGFSYLAECCHLSILEAVEEESGSEVSAAKLIEIIHLIQTHQLPAVFIEINGSTSAADIIAAETGVKIFTLDMAISGTDYFEAMYHNIDTLQEALK